MATAFHAFPNYDLQALNSGSTTRYNVTAAGALKVLLIAPSNTFTYNSTAEAVSTVTLFLAGSGGGALTEVSTSGTGYTRQVLTGVTVTDSGANTTLTCNNPSWTASTFNATYAMFYDFLAGGNSDTNGIPVCYWDFGGTQSVTAATFTLTISGSGLVQWACQ